MLGVQLAVATVLLVSAGLLLRSFAALNATDAGFSSHNTLLVPIELSDPVFAGCASGIDDATTDVWIACDGAGGAARRSAFLAEAVARLEALPGVSAVGATNVTPLSGPGRAIETIELTVDGFTPPPGQVPSVDWRVITSGFFPALGVPIVRGRNFTAAEDIDGGDVVIVSETLARHFWPSSDPIGRRIAFGSNSANWRTVIGVAADIRDRRVDLEPQPIVFLPNGGNPHAFMTIAVGTDGSTAVVASGIRAVLRGLDPGLAPPTIRPVDSYHSESIAIPRFNAVLMSVFAGIALLLGAFGVYGVTLFGVVRRTREFGVRFALGARRADVLTLVLRRAALTIGAGVTAGLATAAAVSRLLQGLLFGTQPLEPVVYAGVAALLAAIAVLACIVPAVRASRIDPRRALTLE